MYILLGAHSVGKTTLLKALKESEQIPDYYVSDGFSRPVKSIRSSLELSKEQEQITINELTCWAFQNYITQQVISTRSPIDAIVYTQYYTPLLSVDWIQEIFDKYKGQVDGVFYIPIEFELENDGVRFTDVTAQKDIDIIMRRFIKDNNLQTITLSGTVEERVEKVLLTMKRPFNLKTLKETSSV